MPVEIILNGPIYWWSQNSVSYLRRNLPKDKSEPVIVDVNSEGGDPFEGFAIYNLLAERENLTVRLGAVVASAASYIPFAADKVIARDVSVWMAHEASGGGWGNAESLAKRSRMLAGIDKMISNFYAKKTGKKPEEVYKDVKNEIWLFGGEAIKAYGIADEVEETGKSAPEIDEEGVRNTIEHGILNAKNALMEKGPNKVDLSIFNSLLVEEEKQPKEEEVPKNTETKNSQPSEQSTPEVDVKAAAEQAVKNDRTRVKEILSLSGLNVSDELLNAIETGMDDGDYAKAQLKASRNAQTPAPNSNQFNNVRSGNTPDEDVPEEETRGTKAAKAANKFFGGMIGKKDGK
jgi:ATP-dependent protease ClpP protease subunit